MTCMDSGDAWGNLLQSGQQRLRAERRERIAPLDRDQVLGRCGHAAWLGEKWEVPRGGRATMG
jgi:hypothetical protein